MYLHTERLSLVPLGPEHLISTHKYARDIENTQYMVHLPNTNIGETSEFLDMVHLEWLKDSPDSYEFAILLDEVHIGAVSIYIDKENATGELGWIINKEYWGNGFATEAAREIMNFALNNLNIKKFIAHCDSENIGSYKVMAKLGLSLVEISKGRKNKSSDEDREEMMYSLEL